MKIVKLEGGIWPSEFEMQQHYQKIFEKHGLHNGRMVGGSKSGYFNQHPDNVVVFNANIIIKKAGKVWYGDLDITLDFDKLKEIADELKEDLYVLREMDARFDNDKANFKFWKKKAVEIIKTKK